VRTAAKLCVEAVHVDYPDHRSVFVPEECEAVFRLFVEWNFKPLYAAVFQDFFVCEFFYFAQLFGRRSFKVREVKAQAFFVYEGPCLMDMLAKHLAKRPVQDVRCAVVTLNCGSSFCVYVQNGVFAHEGRGYGIFCDFMQVRSARVTLVSRISTVFPPAMIVPVSPTCPPFSA